MARRIFAAVFVRLAAAMIAGFAAVLDLAAQTTPPTQTDQPKLIFSPWVKLCNKDSDPGVSRFCATVKDGRTESGLLVVSVALIERDGDERRVLRTILPYGVALQHGTRMIVDQDTPAAAPYVVCLPPTVPPGGCVADYNATADVITRLKTGRLLTVQGIHMNGQAIDPQFDLKDFAQVYDGAPTDPKVYEARQEEIRQKSLRPWKDDTLQPHLRPKR